MDKQQKKRYQENDEHLAVSLTTSFRHRFSTQNAGEDSVQDEIVEDHDVRGVITNAQKDDPVMISLLLRHHTHLLRAVLWQTLLSLRLMT